jgi:UDP-glucose 4-epimerase
MRFRSKRVLVTGGGGFVGSNLVKKLYEEGANITVLDDLFTGNLSHIGHYAKFTKGSVTDYDLVELLVKEVDIVFNLAARNIIVSTEKPREDFEVNVGGMLNILLAARKHGVDRIVYTSSASVYGNLRYIPINEDDGLSILNPYAASKLSAEHYCMAFWESFGVPITILRYSNVYGPNQSPSNPYCGVVSKFFEFVIADLPIQIHGDGEQTRDFTFVDDAVEATLLAAQSPRAVGEVFNIGTGKETSVNQLADIVIDILGRDGGRVYVDRRDIDNLRRRVLNIEKSRRILRWIPMTLLKNGLYKTYQWLGQELRVDQELRKEGYERRDG